MLFAALLIIVLSGALIYFAGERFAESSSNIANFFGLPPAVKGATFDAISGSLPELMVALFSVIFFKKFEVGVGTIAGSALFNLLVIPGLCVFLAPVVFKVSRKVISRDAFFYLMSVFVLLVLLFYFPSWSFVIALFLLVMYVVYVREMVKDTRVHKKQYVAPVFEGNIRVEWLWFFSLLLVIGGLTYLLTLFSIELATILSISPIIIAFTITAAATSIPDTVISVVNAKKGNVDDVTSNVFGSNIFDILVGLGLPLLIYSVFLGPVEMAFGNIEIVFALLGATILTVYFFADSHELTKKQGIFLLFLYVLFVTYTIMLAVF